ncbi:MAG: c-type cytochrome [Proteobacteria bacterium]|nr:c-type cytochrome [Pseudomonadota bacterium]MBU1686123.1 c-type cytochrome [Pseudomonadota bacterium]
MTSVSPALAFEPLLPIPTTIAYNRPKALLGRALFSDPILSLDKTISCASCHDLNQGGSDPAPCSTGVKSQQGVMQSPTVFNSVFNFRQFWDGRAADLKDQVKGPIESEIEMQMTPVLVEQRLNNSPDYLRAFRDVYGHNSIKFDEVTDAIAEFEKALITPNSRFDRFLRGEIALSSQENEGYLLFKELGCITCHNGLNMGGNSFQKLGVLNPVIRDERYNDRFKLTLNERDLSVYKVPTLRNIELTSPYFHDGSKKDLHDALKIMTFHNLGMDLTNKENNQLVAFLHTLTGQSPEILGIPSAWPELEQPPSPPE